ncbi:KpsF/GutQ family sugar-phosphate isomerase [Tropicimonas sp.]|uniref:KpsF/GutQ family sugar-phosphate isomerase n=1 Tax=Tropicimonas sp. TaxID=2067044 RepID=UPI003A843DC1
MAPPADVSSRDSTLSDASRVLRIEGQALLDMAEALPRDLAGAIGCILACRGRVIVSGIGKSGHVGRKIAATLASTGTPAYFVHAAEASHGDLGMIARDDVCLLISNSGETPELRDLVAYTRRFSIPLIAISSRADSSLMRAADYRLLLPPAPEACSIGMAPTTSTTLTLALGDALAVSLMARRGFRPQDFNVFHPGGKLGAQMVKVEQLMHGGDAVPLVESNTDMRETLLVMTSRGFGIAGVLEDGRLAGVITDGDLRRNMDGLLERRAIDIASRSPVTVRPDMLAAAALATLNQRAITALFVVDETGVPVGVLHVHDCLRAGVV